MSKRNKPAAANSNDKPSAWTELHELQGELDEARSIIETVFLAIDQADDDQDGDGVTKAINTLRVGVRALHSFDEKLDRFSGRLLREGCPPENVKKPEGVRPS